MIVVWLRFGSTPPSSPAANPSFLSFWYCPGMLTGNDSMNIAIIVVGGIIAIIITESPGIIHSQ